MVPRVERWPAAVALQHTRGHRASCIRRHVRRHINDRIHIIRNNTMKKLAIFATLLFVALLITTKTSFAQPYTCIIVNGQKCYVTVNADGTIDTTCDNGSTGQGDFKSTTGPIPARGDVNTTLVPSNIKATVKDQTLGNISTTLDLSRQSTPTTLTTATPGTRFPLIVKLNFFANASIDARPGITYQSASELNFFSNSVSSVDPFVAETLTLQNDVDFYDKNDPTHTTVFTLQGGTTNVTLGKPAGGGNVR
jgi:hypothetical protein